jgi:hypothetical protein
VSVTINSAHVLILNLFTGPHPWGHENDLNRVLSPTTS